MSAVHAMGDGTFLPQCHLSPAFAEGFLVMGDLSLEASGLLPGVEMVA